MTAQGSDDLGGMGGSDTQHHDYFRTRRRLVSVWAFAEAFFSFPSTKEDKRASVRPSEMLAIMPVQRQLPWRKGKASEKCSCNAAAMEVNKCLLAYSSSNHACDCTCGWRRGIVAVALGHSGHEMRVHRRNVGRSASASKVKGLAAFALASGLAMLMRPSANGAYESGSRVPVCRHESSNDPGRAHAPIRQQCICQLRAFAAIRTSRGCVLSQSLGTPCEAYEEPITDLLKAKCHHMFMFMTMSCVMGAKSGCASSPALSSSCPGSHFFLPAQAAHAEQTQAAQAPQTPFVTLPPSPHLASRAGCAGTARTPALTHAWRRLRGCEPASMRAHNSGLVRILLSATQAEVWLRTCLGAGCEHVYPGKAAGSVP
eukprot:scaffold163871_cov20-Tisochrysis_lutea.AAC.1